MILDRGSSIWEFHARDQERIRKVQQRTERRTKTQVPITQPTENVNSTDNDAQQILDRPLPGKPNMNSQLREAKKREEREARKEDFETMKQTLIKSARKRILYSTGLWFFFALFLWIGGAAIFYITETAQTWTYFTAVYFTFISLLAIGYGDNILQSMPGKAFFVLWSLVVVPTLTMLITTGVEAVEIGVPEELRT